MPTMTPWHAIVTALRAEGIDRVFGLPGNPLHLVADLARHAPDIRNILVRHEPSTSSASSPWPARAGPGRCSSTCPRISG